VPSAGIRKQGGGVEEIACKGGEEKGGREARGAAAGVVFVELREAGADVAEGGEPGEELAD